MMTIRETLTAIISGSGDADEKARLICGYLSCEVGVDNGNGWYDNDEEMATGGLEEAEELWMGRK